MLILKKKSVLHELAVSLFLMLEFNPDTTALCLMKRVRDRAIAALQSASVYTGLFGEKNVQEFLASKQLKFTICCGKDIVKGDIIRFVETVFNNCRKPPRQIGKRGITAEVTNVIHAIQDNPMLHMRVIASGGVWDLAPETEIHRPLKNMARLEVMRVVWDDETKREEIKSGNLKAV